MARDHARIHLDLWGDDDWMDLSVDAQMLYLTLYTNPGLSFCGAGEWHPGRLSARASDWTVERIETAAAELSRRLFVVIDTETGEYLLRSWIKHDGLWRTPNMAVSVANARGELSSRTLRGVVVFEVAKLKKANADSNAWERPAVAKMLAQKPIDAADLEPFNPAINPVSNGARNGAAKGAANPYGQNGSNPTAKGGPTPAPTPSSSSNSIRGYVSTEGHQGANPDLPPIYPNRCPDHAFDPKPPKCGACGEVRKADEALQRSLRESAEEMRKAFWREVENCTDCGPKGQIDIGNGTGKCPHHDWSLINA